MRADDLFFVKANYTMSDQVWLNGDGQLDNNELYETFSGYAEFFIYERDGYNRGSVPVLLIDESVSNHPEADLIEWLKIVDESIATIGKSEIAPSEIKFLQRKIIVLSKDDGDFQDDGLVSLGDNELRDLLAERKSDPHLMEQLKEWNAIDSAQSITSLSEKSTEAKAAVSVMARQNSERKAGLER